MSCLHFPWLLLLILLRLGDPRDRQNWGSVKIAHQHRREGQGGNWGNVLSTGPKKSGLKGEGCRFAK